MYGIDGVVVHTEEEVTRELTKAMERECNYIVRLFLLNFYLFRIIDLTLKYKES